ncbi:MAG TPA: DNA sulfur modification protein DndB [Polyangium sp.]|nr:DNA sulfur modification protein DndB [Polyangium sp.]
MDTPFEVVFPAIRGVQAHREFYVSMCPMRLLPRLFLFNEEDLLPELRAQRTLNKGRIPDIAQYITDNRDSYTFSAITASIDGDVRFEAFGTTPEGKRIGVLHVPMASRFVINDGQHRRAAIEHALREKPDLADESIAVVFFLDIGLERCQQMFADLNRYAVRPSPSIGVLYDHRDDAANITRRVIAKLPLFKDLTEMASGSLSARSRKLFTLSALYAANNALFSRDDEQPLSTRIDVAANFWNEVARNITDWNKVHERKLDAGEVRRDFLHSHGVILHAVGRVGRYLLHSEPHAWKKPLRQLAKIDWSKHNAELWEGRVLVGGRVSKGSSNVILAANLIKQRMDLPLTETEQATEEAFLRGQS